MGLPGREALVLERVTHAARSSRRPLKIQFVDSLIIASVAHCGNAWGDWVKNQMPSGTFVPIWTRLRSSVNHLEAASLKAGNGPLGGRPLTLQAHRNGVYTEFAGA